MCPNPLASSQHWGLVNIKWDTNREICSQGSEEWSGFSSKGFEENYRLMSGVLATWQSEIGNCRSRLAWANSSIYPITKINRAKWTGGVVQVIERLLCQPWSPEFQTPVPPKKVGWGGWNSSTGGRGGCFLPCILWVSSNPMLLSLKAGQKGFVMESDM
jgi:hypothetical protein